MIFIGMNHPKHFWMFKNLIYYFKKNGIKHLILVSDKDVLIKLLEEEGLEYKKLGGNQKDLFLKIVQFILYSFKTLYFSILLKPKIYLGQALPHFAFATFFLRKSKFIILEDTEHVKLLHKLTVPFCYKIYTPSLFPLTFKEKQVKINSIYELLYLHPTNFSPDSGIFKTLKINQEEEFVILRTVSWNAHHDNKNLKIPYEFIDDIIHLLEKNNFRVFLSSEGSIPMRFEKYLIKIKATEMHSVLFYASLYIGEGASMAAEAAVIGTPSIYINNLNTSVCEELSSNYNLLYNFRDISGVFKKVEEIIKNRHRKQTLKENLNLFLNEKVEPVEYFINEINNLL